MTARLSSTSLNVLVLGMHRSGTSAVAGALAAAGLYVGEESELLAAHPQNPAGFVERRDIMDFNDRLLGALGWSWDTPSAAPLADPPALDAAVAEGRELVAGMLDPHQPWLLKDPRLSLLLPWWRRILLDRFVAVVSVRPPEEVAWSLSVRDNFTPELGIAVWAAYHRHMAAGLDGLPVITVDYPALTTDPARVVDTLLESLLALGVEASFDADAAKAAVKPELRRATQPASLNPQAVPAVAIDALAAGWAVDSVAVQERFARDVGPASSWESSLLERHRAAVEARARADDLEPQIARERHAVDALTQDRDRVVAALAESERQREQRELAHAQVISELRDEVRAVRVELAEREEGLRETRGRLDEMVAALSERDDALAQARSEVDTLRTELADLLSSNSWRWTAPLRGVRTAPSRSFRRLRLARALAALALRRGPRYATRLRRERALILRSGAFDEEYYRRSYADVLAAGMDPALHYLLHGAAEGRNPNELFDSRWYLATYADVAASRANPLVHYVRHGAFEGRDPSTAFSTADYLVANRDVAASGANALAHYLRFGRAEGRALVRTTAVAVDLRVVGNVPLHRESRRRRIGRRLFELAPLPRRLKAALKPRLIELAPNMPAGSISYNEWIARNDRRTPLDLRQIRSHIAAMQVKPRFSVVMPVYNTPAAQLQEAIDSVVAQLYDDWELCIADDMSTLPHVRAILRDAAGRDARIRIALREENGGIAACTNNALELATGEWLALMDHDDRLAEHALYVVADEINRHPDAALIYSDQDHIDAGGRRTNPYFKPDWDPDLILGQNFINHLAVYRADLARKVGGFREGFEGSQDWDFALRIVDAAGSGPIRHVPFVLYHWRQSSTSFSSLSLERALDSAQQAVKDHLARTGQRADVSPQGRSSYLTVRRELPSQLPLVSVIVPTRDRVDLLAVCVEGLLAKTDYPALEVVIVDNDSREPGTLAFLESLANDSRVRVIADKRPFNYSSLVNGGVAASSGEICVLLNNDVAIIEDGWLRELVGNALRPDVGVVGAKLYYADDTIQHAGVILGIGGVAGHANHGAHGKAPGYFGNLHLTRTVSAVTGACLAVRRDIYARLGGFDERLAVAFNDIDFCIRVREAGYRVVWTPNAELYHYESKSRGYEDTPEKIARFRAETGEMRRRWGPALTSDPYYNANLALEHPYALAAIPRVPVPWLRDERHPADTHSATSGVEVERNAELDARLRSLASAEARAVNVVMIYGTPNSGKTQAARALATNPGVAVIHTDEIVAFDIAPTLPDRASFWTYEHRTTGEFDIGKYLESDRYDHSLFVQHLSRRMSRDIAGGPVHVVVVEGYALRRHDSLFDELQVPKERRLALEAVYADGRFSIGPVDVTGGDYSPLHEHIRTRFEQACIENTVPRSTYQDFSSFGFRPPARGAADSDTSSKWSASHLDDLLDRSTSLADIGCNAGYFCFRAAELTAAPVIGVDREQKWLDVASHINSALMRRDNVRLYEIDGVQFLLGMSGTLDIVHCASTYHYFGEAQADFLRAARGALVSEGVLVLEVELAPDGPQPEVIRRSRARGEAALSFPNRAMLRAQVDGLFRIEGEFTSPRQAGAFYDRYYFHLRAI